MTHFLDAYLDKNLVIFLNATSRDEVINALVDKLASQKDLLDREAFYLAICERERLVSTGIGSGVAIPHAKMPNFNDFFIAIGILQKGVDWQAVDQTPVRIVIMIGGPDDKQTEYLQLLSSITHIIKNEEIRKKLLTSNSKEGIIQLFRSN